MDDDDKNVIFISLRHKERLFKVKIDGELVTARAFSKPIFEAITETVAVFLLVGEHSDVEVGRVAVLDVV